jgi:hypothetical protein
LNFIFLGGTLTPSEIARIQLPPEELLGFGFFSQTTLPAELTDRLRQRILAAWEQVDKDGALYTENQQS